ncbi:MAG: hypothetical protein ING69_10535 [Rhodocyclaceae bacterium]|nr:hypothetical protein [Rhodocyclaceae bacterium]
MNRLLATTALAALIATPAFANDRLPGNVRLEALPLASDGRIVPSERALFAGNVKIDDLRLRSIGKIAPSQPFVSVMNFRVAATLKLPKGAHALGISADHREWSGRECKATITADGEADPIYEGLLGSERAPKMSENFVIDADIEADFAFTVTCEYQMLGSNNMAELRNDKIDLMIASDGGLPRKITAAELSTEKMADTARTIGAKPAAAAPALADGVRNGWTIETRAAQLSPLYGEGPFEERWLRVFKTPALYTLESPMMAPGGVSMTAAPEKKSFASLAPSDTPAAIQMRSTLLVTPEQKGSTWLGLMLSANSPNSGGNCNARAEIVNKKEPNLTRHSADEATVLVDVRAGRYLVGLWDLPDLEPGAYDVKISLGCERAWTTNSASYSVMLKRPTDRGLRLPVAGDFVVRK